MSTLAQQQRTLLDALFAWPPEAAMQNIAACTIDTRARGLKAYQTNGHMLAERSLTAAYPVVQQLLGEESFADLARALWHAHPPTQGDLVRWGNALPGFLAGSAQLEEEPYLADVATLEWALHRIATLADQEPDLTSLALLTSEDPADLKLLLAVGCSTLQSAWPVASIWSAHQDWRPRGYET